MRHHFDGIIFPGIDQEGIRPDAEPSRRDVLRQFAIGGAATLVISGASLADEKSGKSAKSVKSETPKLADYDRYVVVPKDFRAFKVNRRKKLGIGGGYFRVMQAESKKPKAGYLAWLTKDAAKKLRGEAGVAGIHRIAAKDIAGPGPSRGKTNQLMVQLLPNGWRIAPAPKGSFLETGELIDQWSKRYKTVKFQPTRSPSTVLVNLGPAGMPESLLKGLKAHKQVAGVSWNSVLTTQALGEEGATTRALGEEAASTRRRGEEGGTVTTLRVGEEGGKVTTKALGEEGARRTPRASTR